MGINQIGSDYRAISPAKTGMPTLPVPVADFALLAQNTD
jgi:hypothetical protein